VNTGFHQSKASLNLSVCAGSRIPPSLIWLRRTRICFARSSLRLIENIVVLKTMIDRTHRVGRVAVTDCELVQAFAFSQKLTTL